MHTITLYGPEEALVLIPHLLGYRPNHHLIFLALESRGEDASGTRSCLGPVMTLDLEESALDLETGLALARALHGSGIAQAVLVLYCSDLNELDPEQLDTLSMIGDMVDEALDESPGKVFSTYATDTSEWGLVVDGAMLPRPWSELESRPVAAALVYSGSAPGGPEASQQVVVRRSACERLEAVNCAEAWLHTHLMGEIPDERLACLEWDALIKQWNDREERARMCDVPFFFGRANRALRNVGVRDRLLHYGVNPGEGFPLADVSAGDLARGLATSMRAKPDVDHLENLVNLLGHCAAFAADDDPCALSAVAYLLWWYGQNSLAAVYVKEALVADSGYPLAQLLADSLCGRVQPGWLQPG